jgi:hypothetical protein
VYRINHEARINPDLSRLAASRCTRAPSAASVTAYAVHAVAVCASTTQRLLSLATPADVAGVAQRGGRRLSGASLSAAARYACHPP